MPDTCTYPKIIFPHWYDDRAEAETSLKGWINGVLVEGEDGLRFAVSLIDPVRLQQDMEEYVKLGKPYFSEPGLIILPEVTSDAIRTAVRELWSQGFFKHLKPLAASALARAGAATASSTGAA